MNDSSAEVMLMRDNHKMITNTVPELNSQSSPSTDQHTSPQRMDDIAAARNKVGQLLEDDSLTDKSQSGESFKQKFHHLILSQTQLAASIEGKGTLSTKSGTEEERTINYKTLLQCAKQVALNQLNERQRQ